jgi:hypothetical protein
MNALFLTELRGVSFLALWREADRGEIKAILHRAANESQPFCLGAEAQPTGLGPLEIEAMLLPLRHHGSTLSRLLGSLAPGSSPHWLGLIGAGGMRLTSAHTLGPLGSSSADSQATGVPFVDALSRCETGKALMVQRRRR